LDLILWRHAEAEDGAADLTRELTSKGHKQAEKMAAFLNLHLPSEARILTSPATRARQTVAALTQHYTLAPTIAPGASAQALLHAARWPDAGGTVLLVGHQPTLGDVAAELLGLKEISISIRKGAVWWFSHRMREGTGQATLRLVIAPEYL
jgi:phosphohistidine phosphatase